MKKTIDFRFLLIGIVIFLNHCNDSSTFPPEYIPHIIIQPQDTAVRVGDKAVFMVSAQGFPLPIFQWWKNQIIM
jgi:hypothetical protein